MGDQPEQDEERPLMEHVLELRKRLLVVFVAVAGISIATFPLSVYLIDPLIGIVIDPSKVMVYDPLHTFTVPVNLSLLTGIAFSLPIILYEAYKFMAPGLFEDEKKLFAIITPASIVLFLLGASVAYFFVVPNLADVVLGVDSKLAQNKLFLEHVLGFVIKMVAGFGFLFQVPLALLFSIRIDFFSPTFLKEKRLYIYFGFFVISNFVSPDPTMLSQAVVTAIFIVLYEISYRIGYYITPRTEEDIDQFVGQITYLGPLFSSIGVIIGLALSYEINIWWITLSTILGVAIYSSQRFSVSLLEKNSIGNLGFFAPLLSPLLTALVLSNTYSIQVDYIYIIALFVITALFTLVLEKIDQGIQTYLIKGPDVDEN